MRSKSFFIHNSIIPPISTIIAWTIVKGAGLTHGSDFHFFSPFGLDLHKSYFIFLFWLDLHKSDFLRVRPSQVLLHFPLLVRPSQVWLHFPLLVRPSQAWLHFSLTYEQYGGLCFLDYYNGRFSFPLVSRNRGCIRGRRGPFPLRNFQHKATTRVGWREAFIFRRKVCRCRSHDV